jgi:hypothetical protein
MRLLELPKPYSPTHGISLAGRIGTFTFADVE